MNLRCGSETNINNIQIISSVWSGLSGGTVNVNKMISQVNQYGDVGAGNGWSGTLKIQLYIMIMKSLCIARDFYYSVYGGPEATDIWP